MTKEFLAERDSRIFKMRQAGVAIPEIAKRFGISTKVVSLAISRQLEKLNKENSLVYAEVLRMELERLDGLQAALWPLTQHRKITLDDGTEVAVEPDIKAVQQVLAIMNARSKLVGMGQVNVHVSADIIQNNQQTPIRATLAGQEGMPKQLNSFDPESEAKRLLELMALSGVLPKDTVAEMLGQATIIDAEVIESADSQTESRQLESSSGQDGGNPNTNGVADKQGR
jgi:hypothetical protein